MKNHLIRKINNKTASVCVMGLGYVGLPLAMLLAEQGYSVLGFDVDEGRVKGVNAGFNHVLGMEDSRLKELVAGRKLLAVHDFGPAGEADIFIICVPTSLTRQRTPDLQHLEKATGLIAGKLKPGRLVSLESTVFPGTTEEVLLPILERSGLKVEKDFFLCHSPERLDPANLNYKTENIVKLVGAVGSESQEVALAFYKKVIKDIVPVSGCRVAEMVKIFENTFRAVNIALVNEFALLCDRMSICIWDVLEAAFTKPFGIMPFYPGPGVGGHCIPVDPHYLEWKAKEYNFSTRFISLAGEINRKMPEHVREIVLRALNKMGIVPSRAKVLVVGVAYKRDVNDTRESPAVEVINLLQNDGIEVAYSDPYVAKLATRSGELCSLRLDEQAVGDFDLVVIVTDHSNIDYGRLVQAAKKIIDTRNATKNVPGREKKVILL